MRTPFFISVMERALQSCEVGREYKVYLQMQNVTSVNIHLDIGFC